MKREEHQRNIYHAVPITCLDEQSSMTYPNSGWYYLFRKKK
jgi:hypothetical protein